jgi:hypothetical protein
MLGGACIQKGLYYCPLRAGPVASNGAETAELAKLLGICTIFCIPDYPGYDHCLGSKK